MKPDSNSTHDNRINSIGFQRHVRDIIAGTGPTWEAALHNGRMKNQRLIDCAPKEVQRIASKVGFPEPTPGVDGHGRAHCGLTGRFR